MKTTNCNAVSSYVFGPLIESSCEIKEQGRPMAIVGRVHKGGLMELLG